jgi:hypothetical protein
MAIVDRVRDIAKNWPQHWLQFLLQCKKIMILTGLGLIAPTKVV